MVRLPKGEAMQAEAEYFHICCKCFGVCFGLLDLKSGIRAQLFPKGLLQRMCQRPGLCYDEAFRDSVLTMIITNR